MAVLKASALLAILTGSTLAAFETLVNWGQWQWWPWWVVDYVAAVLLVGGGIQTLRKALYGRRLLCAGWAFTLGMAWMSLAGNLAAGEDPARDARVGGFYVALIGLLIAVSLAGLLAAMFAREEA
jgi:hypothetical protein